MNAHVPDRKQCPLSLLQGWASGTKKFVTKDDVKGHNIPTWPELAVSKLWPAVSADPVLKHYFPDKYAKGKVPEREFFWGILFAVKPGYAKKLVSDALELRAASCMDELGNDRAKKMTIAPEILQKMIDAPYFLGKFQVHSCSQATFGQISHPDQHVDKEASLEEACVRGDSKA